jgi:hypothetical protein
MTTRRQLIGGMLAAGIVGSQFRPALAATNSLTWSDLIPGGGPAATAESVEIHDEQGLPIWNAANNQPAPTRPELDGMEVSIRGYLVPIAFLPDETNQRIAAFILAPFVGACIHVPPPPANQIILGLYEAGFQIESRIWFDPVTVTGTLHNRLIETDVARVGYQMTTTSIAF